MESLGAIGHQLSSSPSVEPFSPALLDTLRRTGRNRPVDSTSERALARLRESPYLALRHIKCECHAGLLTLRGRLPTFYTKQVMNALLKDVEGVRRINDCTQVAEHARARRRVG
jgi:hypothetical protein